MPPLWLLAMLVGLVAIVGGILSAGYLVWMGLTVLRMAWTYWRGLG